MNTLLRELTGADAEIYHALRVRGRREHPAQFRFTEAEATSGPARLLNDGPDDFTIGAFQGENLVGIVSVTREKGERMRHKATLRGMYVASEAAGNGLGRRLALAAIDRAREMPGLLQLLLTVVATNARAKGLYASLGFETFAWEPKALRFDDDFVGEEWMVLFL